MARLAALASEKLRRAQPATASVGVPPIALSLPSLPPVPTRPSTTQALRTKWSPEFGARLVVREPSADVTEAQLLRVHSLAHTARVELALTAAKGVGRVSLDSDTIASTGTRAAARRAAGLVVAAVDEVMQPSLTPPDRRPRRAFVMARPPGHHAEADRAMGFCF